MKLLMSLGLSGFITMSAIGAELNVITLGDNEKAGEVLVLSGAKLVKLTAEQKSMQGLMKLAEESKSPVVYFDDATGGTLGFIGPAKVAFVTNMTVEAVTAMSEKQADAILEATKPMPYAEFMQKYGKNPPIPYPTVPLQVAPSMLALLLKDKPSNLVLCKTSEKLYVIEVVSVAADKVSVQIKVHQKK
jgi:hypothetical protein